MRTYLERDLKLIINIKDLNQFQRFLYLCAGLTLRGFIFENLFILELVKHQMNHGKEPRMFFYRDSHRLEADIIVPVANELIAIQVKSASTFNMEFMKSLIKFKKIASDYPINTFVIM